MRPCLVRGGHGLCCPVGDNKAATRVLYDAQVADPHSPCERVRTMQWDYAVGLCMQTVQDVLGPPAGGGGWLGRADRSECHEPAGQARLALGLRATAKEA